MIGATKSGTVLIEMTPAQYEALQKFSHSDTGPDSTQEQAERQEAPAIALTRKLEFVRGCLEKLKPADREELLRSVKSVFRSFGGISESEVQQIVHVLKKEGFIILGEDGKVRYRKDIEETAAEGRANEPDEQMAASEPLVSS